MDDASLDRIAAFHQDLLGLDATGIPIDLGFSNSSPINQSLDESLRAIKSGVIDRGVSVEQAIEEASELSTRYRSAVSAWLGCDDPTIALDFVTTPGVAQQNLSRSLGHSFLYPMIVLVLTFFGFLFLCLVTLPQIDAIYDQLEKAPSTSLSFLAVCRASMPVWGLAIPIAVVLSFIWWRTSGAKRQWSWLPGGRRYYDANRNAGVARQMARMIDGGMSLENTMKLSRPAIELSSAGTASSDLHTGFSPLLDWAIHSDVGDQQRSRVLRMVADTYSRTARRRATILRVAIPTVIGVVIGGAVVFGYGLSFFMPMIELLKEISSPEAAY